MTEGRRKVALLDLAIQVFVLARAHTVDEVLEMADLRLVEVWNLRARRVGDGWKAKVVRSVRDSRFRDRLVSRGELATGRGPVVALSDIALVSVEESTAPDTAECGAVKRCCLDFEERTVGVLERANLDIWNIGIRVFDKLAASAVNLDGVNLLVKAPAKDIQVMNSVVTDFRGRSVPEEVPAVVEAVEIESPIGCGPQVQVPVDTFRDRRLLHLADIDPSAIHDCLGPISRAEASVAHEMCNRLLPQPASALKSDLDHTPVLAGGFDHLAAFPQSVGTRLFAVDILARLASPDRHEGVPVVRRGNGDRVEIVPLKELANVGLCLGSVPRTVFDSRNGFREEALVDITNVADPHAGDR